MEEPWSDAAMDLHESMIANLNAQVENFRVAPGENPMAAFQRFRDSLDENPPMDKDLRNVAATLVAASRGLPTTATGDDDPTIPDLSGLDNVPLPDRMNAYRAALGGQFGAAPQRVTRFVKPSLESLVAGDVPTTETVTVAGKPGSAPDGGPTETSMRHLAVVRAAGKDLDAVMQKYMDEQLAGMLPDGVTIEEQRRALYKETVDASNALTDLWPQMREARAAAIAEWLAANGHPSDDVLSERQARVESEDVWNATTEQRDDRRRRIREIAEIREAAHAAGRAAEEAFRKSGDDRYKAAVKAKVDFADRTKGLRREAAIKALEAAGVKMGGKPVEYHSKPTRSNIGKPLTGRSELVKKMRVAESNYPTAWMDALHNRFPKGMTLASTTRGYFSVGGNGYGRRSYDEPGRPLIALSKGDTVATHELGHAMEKSVPGLLEAQRALLWARTSTGEVGSRTAAAEDVDLPRRQGDRVQGRVPRALHRQGLRHPRHPR